MGRNRNPSEKYQMIVTKQSNISYDDDPVTNKSPAPVQEISLKQRQPYAVTFQNNKDVGDLECDPIEDKFAADLKK